MGETDYTATLTAERSRWGHWQRSALNICSRKCQNKVHFPFIVCCGVKIQYIKNNNNNKKKLLNSFQVARQQSFLENSKVCHWHSAPCWPYNFGRRLPVNLSQKQAVFESSSPLKRRNHILLNLISVTDREQTDTLLLTGIFYQVGRLRFWGWSVWSKIIASYNNNNNMVERNNNKKKNPVMKASKPIRLLPQEKQTTRQD